jgi:N-acetylneuraminate lyase
MVNEKIQNMSGLIAATFTPMEENGRLALSNIPKMVNQLIAEGISGLFVCGGTGEGVSLTNDERKTTAEAFVQAAAGRVPVIVHVGQNSLLSAQSLAKHAASINADAISAMTPNYFKPSSISTLIDSLAIITQGAPDLPFIYYHFPAKSGLPFDLPSILKKCAQRLPSLFGVKFTDTKLFDLQAGLEVGATSGSAKGRYKFFYGADEMLLSGLAAGAHGAIGSTYNFAAPLYQRIIAALQQGDAKTAHEQQALSVQLVRTFLPYGGIEGQKAIMSLIGLDCGPCRLPNKPLAPETIVALRNDLAAIGFFDWARS